MRTRPKAFHITYVLCLVIVSTSNGVVSQPPWRLHHAASMGNLGRLVFSVSATEITLQKFCQWILQELKPVRRLPAIFWHWLFFSRLCFDQIAHFFVYVLCLLETVLTCFLRRNMFFSAESCFQQGWACLFNSTEI